MAKKKTIDLRSVEPTPVPAGDVDIFYNGTRIAGFSEDTDATLKTGGTRVEHDIAVSYTKPENNLPGLEVNVNDQTAGQNVEIVEDNSVCAGYQIDNERLIILPNHNVEYIIPYFNNDNSHYEYAIRIIPPTNQDVYNVTVNNTAVPYSNDDEFYNYNYSEAVYPTGPIAITISDKQV